MDLVPGVEALHGRLGRLLVAIGVFDGLHRGHTHLLERLVADARRLSARPGVITFDAHPDAVLLGAAPPLLLDPDERLERLGAAGVEVAVVQHFDDEVRRTPFDAFVRAIAERVDVAGFVMTPDSAFGHQRRGTPDAVAALGRELGFEVVVVPAVGVGGRPVSSSDIRRLIAAGELNEAAELLGRPYAVVAHVDAAGHVTTPVPVAWPPPGRYRVQIDEMDVVDLEVPADGDPTAPGIPGGRHRIVFAPR